MSLVANVAAQVLGVREETGKPMLQTLCAHIKEHKLLLIIDNCEHLVAACAVSSTRCFQAAPRGARHRDKSRRTAHSR